MLWCDTELSASKQGHVLDKMAEAVKTKTKTKKRHKVFFVQHLTRIVAADTANL